MAGLAQDRAGHNCDRISLVSHSSARTCGMVQAGRSLGDVHAQADRVVVQLREHFPKAAQMLEDAWSDILAFAAFPVSHWQKHWSNNSRERLNKEMRRRRACPCRERGGHLPQPGSNAASGGRGSG